MTSPIVKVVLLLCLVQLSARLASSATIPPVTSATEPRSPKTDAPGDASSSTEEQVSDGTTPLDCEEGGPTDPENPGDGKTDKIPDHTKKPGHTKKTRRPCPTTVTKSPATQTPPALNSADGKTEATETGGPTVTRETKSTPPAIQDTGIAETKSPGETGTKVPGTETIAPATPPANHHTGIPETKSPGETGTKVPGTETKAPGTPPANHHTGIPETKSPYGETEAPGTKSP